MRVLIDNQVISFVSGIFSIRPLSRYTNEELQTIPRLTWGSRSIDNKVISLLITNNVQITELDRLTSVQIDEMILERYNQMIRNNNNNRLTRTSFTIN
jgi:hypothetical protein